MFDVFRMREEHLNQAHGIQGRCYIEEYQESIESLNVKLRAYPAGCIGIKRLSDGLMVGYIIFFPWVSGAVVPLNASQILIPNPPNCLYIHDFCLLPEVRGFRLGEKIMKMVVQHALSLNIKKLALISVQNSQGFWKKMGFVPIKEYDYGNNLTGVYMEYSLS